MVGRFGLYSRRSYKKAILVLSLYSFMRTRQLSLLLETKKEKKTYRQRIIESFDKDPFIYPHCHRQMELVEIWHADYGFLYHYMEGMDCIKNIRGITLAKNKEQDDLSKDFLKWLEEEDPFGLDEDIKIIIFKCLDCGKEDL